MKRKFNRTKLIAKINQDLEKANLPLIVDIYVERQGDFTVASVLGGITEDEEVKGYNGLGISKRSVHDKPNASYGAKLAVSRAVSNMIQKFRKINPPNPPMRREYDFTGGSRGKHADKYAKGVVLPV